MRRRPIAAMVIAAAVLAAGYGAWWLHAAGRLRDGVALWADSRRAEGWQVTFAELSTGGFPLRIEAVARSFDIAGLVPSPWRWTGPRLVISAPPWFGHEFTLSSPGAHRIEIDSPGGVRVIELAAARATGTVRADDRGRVASIEARLGGVAATESRLGAFHAERVSLALMAAPAAQPPAAGALRPAEAGRLMAEAEDVELPPGMGAGLGPRIARFESEMALLGPIPPGPARAALDLWRDAGGTLELRKVKLLWGGFQLEAEGTMALDADRQPIGAATARMWGVGSAIDALVAAGEMRPRDGATAKIVLHMMAKNSTAQGIPPEVEAPLSVQDRRIYLGPVALAPVPRIDWP